MTDRRNGAQALLATAQELGIRACFANPGTTELTLVRALDDAPLIRPVLGLFEGVCTGAADGYARVAGIPALTLLHLGPGLANGLANLHNARRAHTPIINIVGDHATWHLPFDAPLTSDIDSLANPVSSCVIHLRSAVSANLRRAVQQSMEPPGSVVTVVAPSDVMDAATDEPLTVLPKLGAGRKGRRIGDERVAEAARRIVGERPVLLLGSDALTATAQQAAMRVASATGGRLIMESYPAIVELGGGLPALERLAYFPQDVLAQLGDSLVVLVGARPPVSYFGYEGQPSELAPRSRVLTLSQPGEDSLAALQSLAECLRGNGGENPSGRSVDPPAREAILTPSEVAESLVKLLPEGTIMSLEGSTCGAPYLRQANRARRHRVMTNTGGAIGQGIPCAVGAAVASPSSQVICLQSDGSAQYTLQALWTLAREQLNVVVVICANHRYGILQTELKRGGAVMERPALERLTRLHQPRIDWVALAKGYGVAATRAATSVGFHDALRGALATRGPHLIEAQIP